jgi:hypothetical protein
VTDPRDRQVLLAVMQEIHNISANYIVLNKRLKDLQSQVKEFVEQTNNGEPNVPSTH